jgi:phenylpropionate dioxygenase-like ring-hydroxylating dioxygenase large terminal subunit
MLATHFAKPETAPRTVNIELVSEKMVCDGFPIPPGWYVACRRKDLRKRPLRIQLFGRSWAIFATESGEVGVVEDRCIHRGMALSQGTVCGSAIQCPYHGWEYDHTGRVVRIPSDPEFVSSAKYAQSSLRASVSQGLVWVVWGNVAEQSPPSFDFAETPGWTTFVMRTRFRGTVDNCLENFLDCPHAVHVHKYWFRAPTSKPVKVMIRSRADGAEAEFFEEPRERSAIWALLAPRKGGMRHVDRFIAPNTSRVEYDFPSGLRYLITSSCCPISESETEVYTVISFCFGRVGPLVRLFFEPLCRMIIRQDVRMVGAQQANLEKSPPSAFVSTSADVLGSHIRQWRAALIEGHRPPVAGQERHVTICL